MSSRGALTASCALVVLAGVLARPASAHASVFALPVARVAVGLRAGPATYPQVDFRLGARLIVGSQPVFTDSIVLTPSLGGSFAFGGGHSGGLFALEAGVGWFAPRGLIQVSWVPAFVYGQAGGAVGAGMRNTLRVEFLFGIIGIELGHEFRSLPMRQDEVFIGMITLEPINVIPYFGMQQR